MRDSYALEQIRKISKHSLLSLKQTCKIFAQYLKVILKIINFIEMRLTMEKQHFDLSSICIHVYLNLMHPCTDGCCLDDGHVQPCIGDAVIFMI